MKKIIVTAILILSLGLVGCGKGDASAETAAPEIKAETETEDVIMGMDVTESMEPTERAGSTEMMNLDGEDNFSADPAKVKEFAQKIKEAVAASDLEKLADLVIYPTYVGFSDTEGSEIAAREDFIALGKDKIFTPEMIKSIADANIDNLEPSMAGFNIIGSTDADIPSITFGMENGELGIKGINY